MKKLLSYLISLSLVFQLGIMSSVSFAEDITGEIITTVEEAVTTAVNEAEEVVEDAVNEAEEVVGEAVEEVEATVEEIIEEIEEEVATLVEEVSVEDVVEAIEEVADTVEESEVDEEEAIEIAEEAVEDAVEEIIKDLEGESSSEVAEAIEEIEENIEEAIEDIEDEIAKNPGKRKQLERKIMHLKKMIRKLRAKVLTKHKKAYKKIQKVVNRPGVSEIRWGALSGNRSECVRSLKPAEIRAAITAGETPEGCESEKVEYSGSVSVDSGTLTVKKELLFEKNDEVTVESGSTIKFTSNISTHWDGLLLYYEPELNDDGTRGEVNVTISIGDLTTTKLGSEIFGRHSIGNGHEIEIKRNMRTISGVSSAKQKKLVQNKLGIENKLNNVRKVTQRMRMLGTNASGAAELEGLTDEIAEYNYDDTSAAEVQAEIEAEIGSMAGNLSAEEIGIKIKRLKAKIAAIKEKAKGRKYNEGLIPFKDTDDTEWYADYVGFVKNRGIISGYKDAAGNALGEYRPANNVTVAEILKVALETAEEEGIEATPELTAALNHWAKKYVVKGERLGLNILEGNVDLNRPATRGEVIRLTLEALGVTPEDCNNVDFSDVSGSHPQACFIQQAKDLGIISGDAGKTTFRPNAPVNRAEVAKIIQKTIEVILGETE